MKRMLFLASFGQCRRQTVQRRLLPLARAMAARGHAVRLLIPTWDCPHQTGRRQMGAVTVVAPALGPGVRGVYPGLPGRLQREIMAFAPDLLFVSKGLGYAGRAMRWWMQRGGVAVLDVDDLEKAWLEGGSQPWRRLMLRQEAGLVREAAGVTLASHFLLQYWRPQRPSDDAASSYLLPNGLTRATSRTPVEKNPPRALLLTRGHDVDARALTRVWRETLVRAPGAELLIAGGWQDAPQLPRTRVLGWLAGRAYRDAIVESSVCLFLPPESPLILAKSPARVLDCIAAGVPVVASDVGEYGALMCAAGGRPAGSEGMLIEQLAGLLQDAGTRARLSRKIYERASTLSWRQRAAGLDAWLSAQFGASKRRCTDETL